ncbi:MAG: glucose-1-phosphate adenylyltransferase [Bacteroidetes bacterium]|nr:glucose-1-phosphate adenylyltransferase [Bacteroidota bacterium]MBU1115840.1 glucose-1-phosphate adenylyltransferase [Bacteroidota bacterium]MBU1800551.1 glucose-1-phosphate adenylyltransferase [Bacteroidota bacterium]
MMTSNNLILKKTLTMVLASGYDDGMLPLTENRAKSSIPFGGKYRIIDIALSNCINSGLRRIYILTQYKSDSLHKHIYKAWKIFQRELKEFIYWVPPQLKSDKFWYSGNADAVNQNINLLKENDENLLVLSGNSIYKMDYSKFIEYHNDIKADLTISYANLPMKRCKQLNTLKINSNNKILGFNKNHLTDETIYSKSNNLMANIGIYVFRTKALKEVLNNMHIENLSIVDFAKDVIPYMIHNNFSLAAYPLKDINEEREAYWADIENIDSYYNANMDLLEESPGFDLYDEMWQFRTYQGHYPPVKTISTGNSNITRIHNSLVADGSVISGGTVAKSVLGFKVMVENGAHISDSIIMDYCKIGYNSRIRRAIIDKNVVIPENVSIGFDLENDMKNFLVTDSGIVMVPKNYVFSDLITQEHSKIDLLEARKRNVTVENIIFN